MDEKELRQLKAVGKAFSEARDQLKRYRKSLAPRREETELRAYAVVAVGLERLLSESTKLVPGSAAMLITSPARAFQVNGVTAAWSRH